MNKERLQPFNGPLQVEGYIQGVDAPPVGRALYPRLRLAVVLELREYIHASNFENIQTVVFGSLTGELQVQGQTIGHVLPLSVRERALTHHPYHQTLHLSPEIPLDPRRLEWLEEQRNGKTLS